MQRSIRDCSAAAFVLIGLIIGAVAAPISVLGQRLEFEVASVKRNTVSKGMDMVPRRSGDLVMMHDTQPFSVIFYAYRLTANYQIEGYKPLPDGWNWYDIDARVPAGATDDAVRLMFQSLLADRFKLKVHRETKEIPQYELVIHRGGPKLRPPSQRPLDVTIEGRTYTQRAGTCGVSLWREGTHLVCHAATMAVIVSSLTGQLRMPVLDRTGLMGTYDVHIRYLPDGQIPDADIDTAPTLAQAIQEELGLRLEKGKGPVEVLVIDHIEKPSEN